MTTKATFTKENLSFVLNKYFGKYENSTRIEKAVENITKFVHANDSVIYSASDIRSMCQVLGLETLIRRCNVEEQEKVYACIERFVLYEFFACKCLTFSEEVFEKQELSFSKDNLVLNKTSADMSDWATAAGNMLAKTSSVGAVFSTNQNVEVNHNLTPTLNIAYQIGNLHIDEFITSSLYLEHYSKMNLSKMQKLQLIFLAKNLVSKQIFINKTLYSFRNSTLVKNGKNILSDYIDFIHKNNLKIYSNFANQKIRTILRRIEWSCWSRQINFC